MGVCGGGEWACVVNGCVGWGEWVCVGWGEWVCVGWGEWVCEGVCGLG